MKYYIFVQQNSMDQDGVLPEWVIMSEQDIATLMRRNHPGVYPDDEIAVQDFCVVHWASPVSEMATKELRLPC